MRKFHRHMEIFVSKGGSCGYDNECIDDIELSRGIEILLNDGYPRSYPKLTRISSSMGGLIGLIHPLYMEWGYSPWMA